MATSSQGCIESCSAFCLDLKEFYNADTWIPPETAEKIKSVAIGAFAGLCVFAVMTTAFYFLQRHCSWFRISQDAMKIFNLFKNVHPVLNSIWKALWRGYAVIAGPILEELIFRGVVNHHIAECQGEETTAKKAIRIFLTSLIFGLAHLSPFQNTVSNVTLVAATFLIGLVFAALREWRKDLVTSSMAHIIYNLSAMI